MNFGEVKTQVADHLNRADLDSKIAFFVNSALHKLENPVDENGKPFSWKYMEKRATTSSSEDRLVLPTRFKEMIWLKCKDTDNKYYGLSVQDKRYATEQYPYLDTAKKRPIYFSIHDATSEILLTPYPDKSYTYDLYYYVYSADLVSNTDTNYWTLNFPEALVYGACLEAQPYLGGDKRIQVWSDMLNLILIRLKKHERNRLWGGGDLRVKAPWVY